MTKGTKSSVHIDYDVDLPGDLRVSTVRLSADHGFGGKPLWYETMVFPMDSWGDLDCQRYETEEEARAGHDAMVLRVMAGEFANAQTDDEQSS